MYSVMMGCNYLDGEFQNNLDNFFCLNDDLHGNFNNDWPFVNDMNFFTNDYADQKPFFNHDQQIDLLQKSWQSKPMEEWSNEEVLDFITSELLLECYENFDYSKNFPGVSGYVFQQMTEEHCKELSGNKDLGELIFKAKSLYLSQQGNAVEKFNTNWDFQPTECIITYPNNVKIEADYVPPRRPGRPRSGNTLYKKRINKRSEKLWEFIINLLKNSETCPELIRWEDFEEGTFKFVQSEKVAQLWGARKKNENMNYEKFSRALRYYYKSKILQAVPGKRLVYKFGPQAKGWRNAIPYY